MTINNKYIKAAVTSLICTVAAAAIMVLSQTFSSNADENGVVDMLMSEIPSSWMRSPGQERLSYRNMTRHSAGTLPQ